MHLISELSQFTISLVTKDKLQESAMKFYICLSGIFQKFLSLNKFFKKFNSGMFTPYGLSWSQTFSKLLISNIFLFGVIIPTLQMRRNLA